jgi:hypothetical protein
MHRLYRAAVRLRPVAFAVLLALGAGTGLTPVSPLWAQDAPAELPAALSQAIALHSAAVAGDQDAASAARAASCEFSVGCSPIIGLGCNRQTPAWDPHG